jgi:peroxiredoxin Q/BCP
MKTPNFSLPDQDGNTVTLDSFRGKKLVLYFYPKADTPGCTTEACGLRDSLNLIKKAGAVVIGVSPDDVKDLKKFAVKYGLPFTLLADPSTKTLQAFGVWGEKQFMGRTYMGVLRTTFLIDENGEIIKKYEKVNPETHADMILEDLGVKRRDTLELHTDASGPATKMPKSKEKQRKALVAASRAAIKPVPRARASRASRAAAKKRVSKTRKTRARANIKKQRTNSATKKKK